MNARIYVPGLLAEAAIALALCIHAPSAGSAEEHGAARRESGPCFFRRDWTGGWRASADARSIYISVPPSIYRLDLDEAYPLLRSPWAVLENLGPNMSICTPLDFNLSVTNRIGAWESPIVRSVTRLTRAQAAELPRKLHP